MRRKLFTLAAGASAVLFVGICVLWVRSRVLQKTESAGRNSSRAAIELHSAGGKLFFYWCGVAGVFPAGPQPWHYEREDEVVDFQPTGGPPHGVLAIEYRYNTDLDYPPRAFAADLAR